MQDARGAALRFTSSKALPNGRSALVLAAGIVASLAVLAAVLADPRMALRAWLAAAFFWSGVPIGAIALLMMMRLIPGIWSSELGVAVEAATMLMPVAALVLVPVLLGTGALYPWAGEAPRTGFRGLYLSQPFFSIRSVAWFALLCVLAFLLIARRRWSTPVSCVGLIVYTVVSTFIATDWLMSLDPEFNSSGLVFTCFRSR